MRLPARCDPIAIRGGADVGFVGGGALAVVDVSTFAAALEGTDASFGWGSG
jgi:hypothetical protein